MNQYLHCIRNGTILTESQLQQVAALNDEQKVLIIRAYNDTVRGLSEFIQELLRSLGPRQVPFPVIPEE